MDHLGVEAVSAISGDPHGLSLMWLAGILALVLAISIVSSRWIRTKVLTVRHLFLKIKIQSGKKTDIGYIRTLDLDRALIVTTSELTKGAHIVLDLSTLPDFPHGEAQVNATVKKIKALGGQPTNFLIDVRFARSTDQNYSSLLSSYLRQLHT